MEQFVERKSERAAGNKDDDGRPRRIEQAKQEDSKAFKSSF
jgi:hypothetical protein